MRCPVCNTENPEVANFCLSCGNRMPERKTTGTSERRVVTILFCDVKGSTALAEKLDPEDWTEIIGGAFRVLTPPIQRYGGTVARLLGDAVLAFFGAPVAHEDDPERAVRAGLEMLQATGAYRERLVSERGAAFTGFDIRIGINTGLAVVGDVGSGQAIEYTGMGDAVNVAARLQSLARPGSMLVADRTFRELPPVFEWEPAGEVEMKGRDAKTGAFVIRGLSTTASLRARPRVIAAPLVGRETEIGALRDALGEIRRGGGRIVSLVGDAGLGKTRLIEELRAVWEAQPVDGQRWSVARGQSYEQTRPYGLFRQHLLSLAGLTDADASETIRERIVALLPEERRRDERALRALDAFLAVEQVGAAPGPQGQELRAEAHAVVRDLVRALGMCQIVFVFDDLQWGDAASADLLMELFELTDEAPILFVCAFRPDRQASSWRVKQKLETDFPHRYTELDLKPLSDQESELLLAHALPGAGVSAELRKRIRDKGDGNPFFLEEIVRGLIDDGTVIREETGAWRVTRADAEIGLPESLQKVLAARIDRLEQEQRETLQAAAVIGRTFQFRVLAAIREAGDRLDRQLRELQRLELVREAQREPEREYAFRHALTQEAAYGSILQRKRRELHLRVAEALVALVPERSEEIADRIGHHFAEAGDPRAIAHLKAAGDRSQRLHALEDALAHYRRALSLVRDETDAALVQDLFLRYGRTLELRGDYAQALELYGELERLAAKRGERRMELAALSAQATIHSNPTPFIDPERAAALIERSVGVAREIGDDALVARLLWSRAQVGLWRGDEDAGEAPGLESAAIARRIGAREQLAFTLNSLAQGYRETNRLADAERVLGESIAIFRELGNRPMEADGLSTLAFIHLYRGDLDAAEESALAGNRIGREIGNDWAQAYGLFTPGYVSYERGDWGTALARWEELIAHATPAGFFSALTGPGSDLGYLEALCGDPERGIARIEAVVELANERFKDWRTWPLAQLGRALLSKGDAARARQVLEQGTAYDRSRGNLYMSVLLALGQGELALAEGRPADALSTARGKRSLAAERGLRPFEKDFDVLAGDALRALGDPIGAYAAYIHALEASRAMGSVRLLWRVHGGLADIAEVSADADEARAQRAQAVEVVDRIARSLADRGLDARFRARREVRAAVGEVGVR